MRIRWTEPAARDLTQIADYLEKHGSGATARRVALSINKRIGGLTRFPEQGRTGRKSGTRELVLTDLPYLVVYRLGGDSIEILRILHGAQMWP
ncbi:MAG: type II toxin-antitoxin system RelE/ParE family toxin [Terriglobales bacterium]|jgi:toxin ParE1/3/4